MFLSFPSLASPKSHAYTIHSTYRDLWESTWRSTRHLSTWSGWFETYGDGLVQHSPESLVFDRDFEDYCASLAVFCRDNAEARGMLKDQWPGTLSRADVAFCAGLRYDEDKKRYYSLNQRKVSASESKKHDKRWKEVPAYADGSPASVYGLMELGGQGLINAASDYTQIVDILYSLNGCWRGGLQDFLKIPASTYQTICAFEALQATALAERAKETADRLLNTWIQGRERDEEKAREAAKSSS